MLLPWFLFQAAAGASGSEDSDDERLRYEMEMEEALDEAYSSYLQRRGVREQRAAEKRKRLGMEGELDDEEEVRLKMMFRAFWICYESGRHAVCYHSVDPCLYQRRAFGCSKRLGMEGELGSAEEVTLAKLSFERCFWPRNAAGLSVSCLWVE